MLAEDELVVSLGVDEVEFLNFNSLHPALLLQRVFLSEGVRVSLVLACEQDEDLVLGLAAPLPFFQQGFISSSLRKVLFLLWFTLRGENLAKEGGRVRSLEVDGLACEYYFLILYSLLYFVLMLLVLHTLKQVTLQLQVVRHQEVPGWNVVADFKRAPVDKRRGLRGELSGRGQTGHRVAEGVGQSFHL